MSSLFIDSSKQPKGIVDIGANCHYCHQLDLLPFDCEFCNHKFCSNHRTLESHNCVNSHRNNKTIISSKFKISSASLFPNRDQDKVKLNESLNKQPTQFRVGDVMKTNAFTKFQKFLKIQKPSKIVKNKFSDIAILKKQAKGDSRIPITDRVYLWCVYIQDPEVKLDIEKVKKPVFINKTWSIGKSLDSISDTLSIRNRNNIINDPEEKLNLFKPDPELMKTSSKSSVLKTGDTVYLVKGII